MIKKAHWTLVTLFTLLTVVVQAAQLGAAGIIFSDLLHSLTRLLT